MNEIRQIRFGEQGNLQAHSLKNKAEIKNIKTEDEVLQDGRIDIGIETAEGQLLSLSAKDLALKSNLAMPNVGDAIAIETNEGTIEGVVAFVDEENDSDFHICLNSSKGDSVLQVEHIYQEEEASFLPPNVQVKGETDGVGIDYGIQESSWAVAGKASFDNVSGGLKYKRAWELKMMEAHKPKVTLAASGMVGKGIATDNTFADVVVGPEVSMALNNRVTVRATPELQGQIQTTSATTVVDPRISTGIKINLD